MDEQQQDQPVQGGQAEQGQGLGGAPTTPPAGGGDVPGGDAPVNEPPKEGEEEGKEGGAF